MIAEVYLNKRKSELLEKVNHECATVINHGFDFISSRLIPGSSGLVDPTFVRRVEVLEVLLFSFVEHCLDLKMTDRMAETLTDIRVNSVIRKEGRGETPKCFS